jgi:hypothetical protein
MKQMKNIVTLFLSVLSVGCTAHLRDDQVLFPRLLERSRNLEEGTPLRAVFHGFSPAEISELMRASSALVPRGKNQFVIHLAINQRDAEYIKILISSSKGDISEMDLLFPYISTGVELWEPNMLSFRELNRFSVLEEIWVSSAD